MGAIGLLGAGTWGSLILRDLVDLGATVHVVDPDPVRREQAAHAGAASVTSTVEDAPEVAAFVVATPATTHATVIATLVDRGAPVFCEKPLTTDVDSARSLSVALGDRLHVLHVWRYHPGIVRLGELARRGQLGSVNGLRSTRMNWTSPRTDTDTTWTLLPHDLTIAIEVLGAIPRPVSATVELIDGRVVGMVATLAGANGAWVIVEVSNRSTHKQREVRVHGSAAVAILDATGAPEITVARGAAAEPVLERIPFDPTPPLRLQLAAVLEHVEGGPAPKEDPSEGVAVVEAITELRRLAGLAS